MSANSRLTVATHILSFIALAERKEAEPVTSERIARSVNTNPVVIRRTLGLLRKAGLVESRRGANAGWMLSKRAEAITLLDVYGAVEEGPMFALHHAPPNPACVCGRGIQAALGQVYGSLDETLRQHLSATTIEQVLSATLA